MEDILVREFLLGLESSSFLYLRHDALLFLCTVFWGIGIIWRSVLAYRTIPGNRYYVTVAPFIEYFEATILAVVAE